MNDNHASLLVRRRATVGRPPRQVRAFLGCALGTALMLAACDGSNGGPSGTGGDVADSGGGDGGADGGGGTVAYSGSFSSAPGDQQATLTIGGVARGVFVYVPTGLPAKPPLIIALHGTASIDDVDQGQNMASVFTPLADAKGALIAAPDALSQPAADWDQHEAGQKFWETRSDADPDRGSDPDRNPDLLLLRAIIIEATRVYGVDPSRIYLVGFSNGGFFSLHAAVALRDQIAAFVELSAGLVRCSNTNECSFMGSSTTCAGLEVEPDFCTCSGTEKPIALPTSGRMPPGLLSHGNQDSTVSVAYTCALSKRMSELGHSAQVVIRDGAEHEMPDYGDPTEMEALWSFLAAHPLP